MHACIGGWIWAARRKAVESYRKVDSYRKVELGTNACMHAWVDLGDKVESYRKVDRRFFKLNQATQVNSDPKPPIEIFI